MNRVNWHRGSSIYQDRAPGRVLSRTFSEDSNRSSDIGIPVIDVEPIDAIRGPEDQVPIEPKRGSTVRFQHKELDVSDIPVEVSQGYTYSRSTKSSPRGEVSQLKSQSQAANISKKLVSVITLSPGGESSYTQETEGSPNKTAAGGSSQIQETRSLSHTLQTQDPSKNLVRVTNSWPLSIQTSDKPQLNDENNGKHVSVVEVGGAPYQLGDSRNPRSIDSNTYGGTVYRNRSAPTTQSILSFPSRSPDQHSILEKKSVSFTNDIRDNETYFLEHKRERMRDTIDIKDVYRGKITGKNAYPILNPVFVGDEDSKSFRSNGNGTVHKMSPPANDMVTNPELFEQVSILYRSFPTRRDCPDGRVVI